MMCSAFVANSYKHGLKGSSVLGVDFNSHEFTPKDVYQLKLFDASGKRFDATSCPGNALISDPAGNGKYCQMVGDFVLELPGFNTVKPYTMMNDHCTAQWPDYKVVRPC